MASLLTCADETAVSYHAALTPLPYHLLEHLYASNAQMQET